MNFQNGGIGDRGPRKSTWEYQLFVGCASRLSARRQQRLESLSGILSSAKDCSGDTGQQDPKDGESDGNRQVRRNGVIGGHDSVVVMAPTPMAFDVFGRSIPHLDTLLGILHKV